MKLKLRKPFWVSGDIEISINGEHTVSYEIESGFLTLDRIWQSEDEVWIYFPMAVKSETLPDNNSMVAFTYGPKVLAGICTEERTLHSDVDPALLIVHDNEREWSNWKSTFRMKGQERGITFMPISEIGYEPYQIYFTVAN